MNNRKKYVDNNGNKLMDKDIERDEKNQRRQQDLMKSSTKQMKLKVDCMESTLTHTHIFALFDAIRVIPLLDTTSTASTVDTIHTKTTPIEIDEFGWDIPLSDGEPFDQKPLDLNKLSENILKRELKKAQFLSILSKSPHLPPHLVSLTARYWMYRYVVKLPPCKTYYELNDLLTNACKEVLYYPGALTIPTCNWNVGMMKKNIKTFGEEIKIFVNYIDKIENLTLTKEQDNVIYRQNRKIEDIISELQFEYPYIPFELKKEYRLYYDKYNVMKTKSESFQKPMKNSERVTNPPSDNSWKRTERVSPSPQNSSAPMAFLNRGKN